MSGRRQILMLPSWYPTEQDPVSGSFFKEQALCLSSDFDFTVITYHEYEVPFGFENLVREPRIDPHLDLVESREGYREFRAKYARLRVRPKVSKLLSFLRIHPSRKDSIRLDAWISSIQVELQQHYGIKPDLLYAMTAQINGVLAVRMAKNFRIPVILAEHNPFPLPGKLLSYETRLAIEGCDALLVVSHDKARQVLMQNISCQPIVVGNLVDEHVFNCGESSRVGQKNLIVVAAYNFYKDFETLLKAVNRLRCLTDAPFRVTVVGFSPSNQLGDFNYGTENFLALVDSFGLMEYLTLIPKAQRFEMPSLYKEADAFVMTSIQEGLPVSALEAAASGLPIFSTRCGGVEDFVDQSTGRLYAVRDYESLAQGLCEFVEGKISFDASFIRAHVVARYGTSAFRNRFCRIVENVLSIPRDEKLMGKGI